MSEQEPEEKGSTWWKWVLGAVIVTGPFGSLAAGILVLILILGALGSSSSQATGPDGCSAPGVINGGSNVDTAMKTLMSKWKLSAPQAAGLVGNWQVESGPTLDPTAKNSYGYSGIVQWDPKQRWPQLQQFASSIKGAPTSLDTQLRFVAWELGYSNEWGGKKGSFASIGAAVKGASSSDESAKIIFDRYEAPGDGSLPKRQEFAKTLASKYASGGGGTTTAVNASSSSAPSATADREQITPVTQSGQQWQSPASTPYRITSGFGSRDSPGGVGSTYHEGNDLVMTKRGDRVLAASAGTIRIAKHGYGGLGNAVIITHSGGIETTYGHMDKFASGVQPGAQVKIGQVIGYEGSTGHSTGPHLHFGVSVNRKYVDPQPFMQQHGAPLNGQPGKPGSGSPVGGGGGDGCTTGGGAPGDLTASLKSYAWADHKPDGFLQQTAGYSSAIARAQREGRYVGATEGGSGRPVGDDCGVFVTTLIHDSGLDPGYNYGSKLKSGAGGTSQQKAWLQQHWQKLPAATGLKLTDLRPGDVGISTQGGFAHVWVYVGNVPGFNGNFAEASWVWGGGQGFAPMARKSAGVLYAGRGDTTYYRKKG